MYRHRNLDAARDEVRWLGENGCWNRAPGLLDDCCGFGRHSLALSELGFDVFGIDLSFDLLESAGELADHAIRIDSAAAWPRPICAHSRSRTERIRRRRQPVHFVRLPGRTSVIARPWARWRGSSQPGGRLVVDLMNSGGRSAWDSFLSRRTSATGSPCRRGGRSKNEGARVVKRVEVRFPSGTDEALDRGRADVRARRDRRSSSGSSACGRETRAGDFAGNALRRTRSAQRQIVVASKS